jgi:hypothetical protein
MKEKAPAMDEVPLSPAKGSAASPAKGEAASPVLIRGLDWAPGSEEESERVTIDREEGESVMASGFHALAVVSYTVSMRSHHGSMASRSLTAR